MLEAEAEAGVEAEVEAEGTQEEAQIQMPTSSHLHHCSKVVATGLIKTSPPSGMASSPQIGDKAFGWPMP